MTVNDSTSYNYPDKIGYIVLLAMEEVMGRHSLNATLGLVGTNGSANHPSAAWHGMPHHSKENAVSTNRKFSFSELSSMQAAMENLYGSLCGQGLALRSGRAAFKYGLREFRDLLCTTDLSFRMLPLEERLKSGALFLAKVFNDHSGQHIQVHEQAGSFIWVIEHCPVCAGRHASSPTCHMVVGMLQEALYWVSGGRHFHVEETQCIAAGDQACSFLFEKKPFD